MTFHRFVALGDSFTEGVGDPDPTRPNGLRGWADRVAEVLATRTDDFGYANLADPRPQARRRSSPSRSSPRIALRARPGHDLRRRQRHPPARRSTSTPSSEQYDAALGRLAATGARLLRLHRLRPGPTRRSTARCAAASRSTTSRSAGPPTGTASPSSTSGGSATTATWRYWTPTACTWAPLGHQRHGHGACSTPSRSRTTSPSRTCPRPRCPRPPRRLAARTPPGRASASRPGSTAASPAAPRATRSRPSGPALAPPVD